MNAEFDFNFLFLLIKTVNLFLIKKVYLFLNEIEIQFHFYQNDL